MHGLTRNAILRTIRTQFAICQMIFDIDDANTSVKLRFDETSSKLVANLHIINNLYIFLHILYYIHTFSHILY